MLPCLVPVIYPVVTEGWGGASQALLPPRTGQICFSNVCLRQGVAEIEWYLPLIQNNSLETYLWGGGGREQGESERYKPNTQYSNNLPEFI